jgi:ubiquinone/menaquinone biosynthesis C-methylase UbiE
VARRLVADQTPRMVLDVGAGAAPWSLAVARLVPSVHVTALDLAPVLPSTRRHVAEAGASGQYDFLAGDVFEADLPHAAYNLVFVANVCHLFDADTNRRLIRRLAPVLGPGGTLAVVDILRDPNSVDSHRRVALYALGLMMRTETGGVYEEADFAAWLTEAELTAYRRHPLGGPLPIALMTAHRPF